MSGRGQKRPVWPNHPSPNCWAKPMRCSSSVGPLRNLGRNCPVPSRTKTQGFKSAKSAQRFVRPRAGLQHVQHAMAFETASDPRQFRTAANNSWSDATAAVAYAVRFLVARSFINMSTINMSTPSRQFQDSISVRARWRWPSTSPAKRERGQCNDDPCAVEGQSRGQHVPSGDRPDGRTRQEFMKVCHGFRMNQQLPNVGSGLDQKNPPVVSPQPSPNRIQKGNVKGGAEVILIQRLIPAVVETHTFSTQDRSE